MIAAVGMLAVAALAIAKSATVGVGSAKVKGHKESVAVNARGVTIYELAPGDDQPPGLQVHDVLRGLAAGQGHGQAVTKAAGVSGKLGTIKRKGFTQVTLNGKPSTPSSRTPAGRARPRARASGTSAASGTSSRRADAGRARRCATEPAHSHPRYTS